MGDAGNPLPAGWEAKTDAHGSTYYINHATKTTSWEPPTAEGSPKAPPPPVYSEYQPPAAVQQQAAPKYLPTAGAVQEEHATTVIPPTVPHSGVVTRRAATPCSCRRVFWITAGLSWVVWLFAVAAAGDENWGRGTDGTGFGVGTGYLDENCASTIANESACVAYDFFVASEKFAAVLCSVAVVLLTVACFRPYEATHGSAQVLGLVGGVFMVLYAFFQMLAFLFVDELVNEHNEEWAGTGIDMSLGPTYGLGVTAFVFGLINAIMVFVLYRQSGDGPLLAVVKGSIGGGAQTPHSGIQQQENFVAGYSSGQGQAVPPPFASVGGGNA